MDDDSADYTEMRFDIDDELCRLFTKYDIEYLTDGTGFGDEEILCNFNQFFEKVIMCNNFEILDAVFRPNKLRQVKIQGGEDYENSLLHWALIYSNVEMVRYLLKYENPKSYHYYNLSVITCRDDDNIEVMDHYWNHNKITLLNVHHGYSNSDYGNPNYNDYYCNTLYRYCCRRNLKEIDIDDTLQLLFDSACEKNYCIYQFILTQLSEHNCWRTMDFLRHKTFVGKRIPNELEYLIEKGYLTTGHIVDIINDLNNEIPDKTIDIVISAIDSGKLIFSTQEKDKLHSVCQQKGILHIYNKLFY